MIYHTKFIKALELIVHTREDIRYCYWSSGSSIKIDSVQIKKTILQ